MTHTMKPSLSLFDVVEQLNESTHIIPLCPSHYQFFSSIPASLPFLSGFEFHLSSLHQPCDALVCFLTRDLPSFTRFSSDSDQFTHLSQANRASQLLLQSPNLLCVTDHIWFELDAFPDESLSLFVGNHSNVQSAVERQLILNESRNLTSQWISTLSENPVPLFDFNLGLTNLFSIVPDWHIAEIGIMDRHSSKAHIKLLLNPPITHSFSDFLDVYLRIFPNVSSSLIIELASSSLARLLDDSDCHLQLSLALFQDHIIGSLEVLPSFDSNRVGQYDEFFCSILTSCLVLMGCPDLSDQLDCQTRFADLDGSRFSSRMHHIKLTPHKNSWIPKVYRDLRSAH